MKIAFVFAGGRTSRWSEALAGRGPSDFFYGAIELARDGHEILCLDAPDPKSSLLAAAYNVFCDARTPVRTRGEHFAAVARYLKVLRGCDAVVAASTSHANALALWKRLGLCSVPIVGIHCGHVNYELDAARRSASSQALQRQEIVLFADSEREATVRQFDVDPRRIHANAFGVDTDFWTPADLDREFVLAVGNDGRRDYKTFLAAMADLPIPVKIITGRPLPRPLPPHVEHLRGTWHKPAVSDEELRDLYRRALVVVVPLEEAIQPSGQSVALQAMACGRPVVLTRTQGLWTGGDFVDGRDLILVAPGSPESLRFAVRRLLDDASLREQIGGLARETVLRHGRIDAFAERLAAIISSATLP